MSRSRTQVPRTLGGAAAAFVRFGSPRLLLVQLACALALRPLFGRPTLLDAAVVAGVIVYWPLQEWVLHRYVLHARPIRIGARAFELAAARTHRLHHERPLDPKATLLPTSTIAVLVPIHVGLWALAAPPAVACTGVAVLGAAALLYEWIHFLTHAAYRPRGAWFREVKRRHMAHHQRDPKRWFGFVVPRLDDWLGTGGALRTPTRVSGQSRERNLRARFEGRESRSVI
jgi:hypothetical protein